MSIFSFINNVKNKVKDIKGIGVKSNPYNSPAFGDFTKISNRFNTEKGELDSYKTLPWVAIAIDALVRDAGNQEWYLEDKKGNPIYKQGDHINKMDKRLITGLVNGFEGFSLSDLMDNVIAHRAITGNALFLKAKKTAFGVVSNITEQFIPIYPGRFSVLCNASQTKIEGYKIRLDGGKTMTVQKEDVIHFSQNRVIHPFFGVGNISKMRIIAQGEAAQDEFQSNFFENGAAPSLFVKDEMELPDEQVQRNAQMLNKKYSGSKNSGALLYLSGKGVDAKTLQISHKDLEWLENKRFNKNTILSLFGVVPDAIGDHIDSNKATANQAILRYYQNINNLLSKLESTITTQHIHLYDKSVFFKFKKYFTGDVEKIQVMVQNGMLSLNEASKRLGLPFDESDEARNAIYLPSNMIDINFLGASSFKEEESAKSDCCNDEKNLTTNENIDEEKQPDLSNPKNVEDITKAFLKSARIPKRFQVKYIRKSLKTRNELEDRFAFRYSKMFRAQKKRVIDNLLAEYSKSLPQNGFKAFEGLQPEGVVNILYTSDDEDEFLAQSKSLHTSGIQRSIRDINELTGASVTASFSNEFVKIAVSRLGKKIKRVNDETRKQIGMIVIKSMEEGSTINEVSNAISDKYAQFAGYRSRLIARTESRIAWDTGAKISYKEIGVKRFDVVGCEGLSWKVGGDELNSDCGVQDQPINRIDTLVFHPNHIGAIAPSEEI